MTSIQFPSIRKEGMVLQTGGPFDKTRCYAPSVVRRGDEYLLYYTGSNDNPSARSGYRLLLARSQDGLHFEKTETPVLDIPDAKCYSAEAILRPCGCIRLYFALNTGEGYKIFRTSMDTPEGPTGEAQLAIDTSSLFSHSIHTLRLLNSNDVQHAYVTGSSNAARSQSQKYKHYRISSDFRIFHGTSQDGKKFSAFKEIYLPPHNFINMYGHAVFEYGGVLYMIFTGFDGTAACKLYITASRDFENFEEPRLLWEPDEAAGEIGMYSACVLPLREGEWRLFYASRAAWKYKGIASAHIDFH